VRLELAQQKQQERRQVLRVELLVQEVAVVELLLGQQQVELVRLHIHKDRVVVAAARNSHTVTEPEEERTDGCGDTAMELVDTEDRPGVVLVDKDDDDNMLVEELLELLLLVVELELLLVEQPREQELLLMAVLAGSAG